MHGLRHILTLIAALLCAALHGQEAQVQRFYLDPTDLEGQVRERLDGNGDRCALIKVQSTVDCEFDGNIVGDVVKKKGTYRVYVCAKDNFTRSIDIIPQGFLPLTVTFADFGIDEIRGGQTYVLRVVIRNHRQDKTRPREEKIIMDSISTNQGYGMIHVDYKPKGIRVKLDGKFIGTSPGHFQAIPVGSHKITLLKKGYKTKSEKVFVSKGQTVQLSGELTKKEKPTTNPTTNPTDSYTSPTYPGGAIALSELAKTNLIYPTEAITKRITGKFSIRFTVTTDGRITRITVIGNPDQLLKNAALSFINSIKRYIPAQKNGQSIEADVTYDFIFKFLDNGGATISLNYTDQLTNQPYSITN